MDYPYSPTRILDARLRSEFLPFAMRVFQILLKDAPDPFLMNWHIDAICHAIQRCIDGHCSRLIIEVPPRHGKSICVSTALPAWLLGRDPRLKILVASYGAELAEEHARHTLRVMTDAEYKRLFPDTVIKRKSNGDFDTNRGGGRRAISVGGSVTGFGADVIIIDDLIKADAARSEAEIRQVEQFLSGTLMSRFNNQDKGIVICIQQRLSEIDPAGYLREKGGYEVLSLPAIAQVHETIALCNGGSKRRKTGDLLWPERFSRVTLKRLEQEMGKTHFSAQYLQNPTPAGGNRLAREWFKSYSFAPRREQFQYVVQSWDTGQSEAPTSDFSVCTSWGLRGGLWHLIEVTRHRLAYHDLLKTAKALHSKWQADKILIEKAGSGHSLLSDLRHPSADLIHKVRAIPVRRSKEERYEEALAQIEAGRFALPEEAPWLDDFLRECLAFPNSRHDDQVDSLSQFILWEKSRMGRAAITRTAGAIRPRSEFRHQQIHDYYYRRYAEEDAINSALAERRARGEQV